MEWRGYAHAAWLCSIALPVYLAVSAVGASAATRMANIKGDAEVYQVVSGLQGPDGMAFHPETGDLYVAERSGGRVSVIKNGSRSTVIQSGFTVDPDIPAWAISKAETRQFLLSPKLEQPASIAFAPDGRLYVAERREYGRLLEFQPDANGQYTTAKLIPVPWLDKPFAWDDLKVSKNGEVFLVGYDEKGEGYLHFGTVLVRDKNEDWWVIDYGPFSSFSGFCLSRNDDILVVCERTKGELVAWDLFRQMPIGTVPESVFKAEAESTCLLSDGSYVVAEVPLPEERNAKGHSRLVRVDPVTAQASGLVSGFDMIGSLALSPESGDVFVSDSAAGVIAEVHVDKSKLSKSYLLQRSLEAFESRSGFSPRVAPVFLKNFLSRISGQQSGDTSQPPGGDEKGEPPPREDVVFGSTFTLREFATKVPLVAGKVRTLLDGTEKEENPVTQIDFLLFFPSHVLKGTDMATPSLSFFIATRKDGTVERSRMLFDNLQAKQRVGDQWLLQTDSASIYVPLATCGMEKDENGMDLNLAFLGMGVYDDFYLRLKTGKENSGSLMVEGKYGGSEEYPLSFVDAPKFGSEPVKNLVVAGFDPAVAGQDLGWLEIGKLPIGTALALGDQGVQRFQALDDEIANQIEQKELERRLETGKAASQVSGEAVEPEPADAAEPEPPAADEAPATKVAS